VQTVEDQSRIFYAHLDRDNIFMSRSLITLQVCLGPRCILVWTQALCVPFYSPLKPCTVSRSAQIPWWRTDVSTIQM